MEVAWRGGKEADPPLPKIGSYAVSAGPAGTLRHEYGHAVEVMAGEAKMREFRKAAGGLRELSGTLSTYGSSNYHEAFAESFARFTHPQYKGDLPKPIHDYMEKLLK